MTALTPEEIDGLERQAGYPHGTGVKLRCMLATRTPSELELARGYLLTLIGLEEEAAEAHKLHNDWRARLCALIATPAGPNIGPRTPDGAQS